MNDNQHNALYNSYGQMKSLMKSDSKTLSTKYVRITTIFKYMPSNNSHVTTVQTVSKVGTESKRLTGETNRTERPHNTK